MASATAQTINVNDPDSLAKELYKRNLELHTERKRTEELLYRVSEAIYATDEKCNLTLFNHTLETLLEKQASEVLGKPVAEILKLTDVKGTPLDVNAFCTIKGDGAKEENNIVPPLAILKTTKKDHYVHIKISTIEFDLGTKEYLVTMSDVTHEKELEKTKDEFISITSHELRTPMSIIKSYLWMLQSGKGGSLTEKQQEYIEKAVRGTERMIALIGDMLSISRMEQGKIDFKHEQFDTKEFFTEIGEELNVKAKEKNLTLSFQLADTIKTLFTDRQKLQEIIVNLVGNAIKFTEIGGIAVKLEPISDNKFVKITITDTGVGIDPEEIGKLFHKFQRIDNSYKTVAESGGTGLGLYIVKLYVEKMGGEVGATSAGFGKGSTFWVTLPNQL